MGEIEYKVDCFVFTNSQDYKEAIREAESIEYIKANTDFNDQNKTVKLYHKLVEDKTLRTVIGFTFLKDLRERILKDGIIKEDNLPAIRVENSKQLKLLPGNDKELEKKYQDSMASYHIKLRNSRIISLFLFGIIIVMMILAIFSDRTKFTNYEKKIQNKYSAWEEDLNARDKALQEKEELQTGD